MNNLGRKLTLVVTITHPKEAKWIWEGIKGAIVHGIRVSILAEGDQVTVPTEIVGELASLGDWSLSYSPNRDKLKALIEKTEKHLKPA